MLNITYGERKTSIWVREKTQVTDVIEQVRRRAGHFSRIRGNRWTLRLTTWKPHERKRPEEDRLDGGETNKSTSGRVPSGRG